MGWVVADVDGEVVRRVGAKVDPKGAAGDGAADDDNGFEVGVWVGGGFLGEVEEEVGETCSGVVDGEVLWGGWEIDMEDRWVEDTGVFGPIHFISVMVRVSREWAVSCRGLWRATGATGRRMLPCWLHSGL